MKTDHLKNNQHFSAAMYLRLSRDDNATKGSALNEIDNVDISEDNFQVVQNLLKAGVVTKEEFERLHGGFKRKAEESREAQERQEEISHAERGV